MERDKLYRRHGRLAFSFTILTLLMSLTLAVLFFVAPENRKVSALIYGAWATLGIVVLSVETYLFNKIRKLYEQDREELRRNIEMLKRGPQQP